MDKFKLQTHSDVLNSNDLVNDGCDIFTNDFTENILPVVDSPNDIFTDLDVLLKRTTNSPLDKLEGNDSKFNVNMKEFPTSTLACQLVINDQLFEVTGDQLPAILSLLTGGPVVADESGSVLSSNVEGEKKFEEMNAPEDAFTNPDHSDYVSKVKNKSRRSRKPSGEAKSTSEYDESLDTKYRARRDKNNVASRRSREVRKMKFVDLQEKAKALEGSNELLRARISSLERIAIAMKSTLIRQISQKPIGNRIPE